MTICRGCRTVEGCFRFEGEDLAGAERAKVQRDQVRAWLDQQMMEKEAADQERKAAEEAYREAIFARDQRALQLDQMEKDCRKRLEEACLRFNRALVKRRRYRVIGGFVAEITLQKRSRYKKFKGCFYV
jgi:hypothetical protein